MDFKEKVLNIYNKNQKGAKIALVILFFLLLFILSVSKSPDNFESNTKITIEEGDTLKEVSTLLKEKNIIRSRDYFTLMVLLRGDDSSLISGDYIFNKRQSVYSVIDTVTEGRYGIPTKSVTLYEGLTVKEMAELLDEVFAEFDKEEFLTINAQSEGYLFPDTYIFFENATAKDITKELERNYKKKIGDFKDLGAFSGNSTERIIKMASILEKEGDSLENMKVISGILWKRIEVDMPLQVDASFVYILGKGTADLSLKDLKVDSPYNSYTNLGLPPTPISNPGSDAIEAALYPDETPFWYFLTGNDGEMYYAKTFEEHKRNKALYLR